MQKFKIVFCFILLSISLVESKKKFIKKHIKISKCQKFIYSFLKKNKYKYSQTLCNETKKNITNIIIEDRIFNICKRELVQWYKKKTKKKINIENPKTFNEKIQWLKLYDYTPLKTQLTDKYLVKEWVKSKIGEKYVIKLLGSWDSFDQINFDLLPNQFVIKTNHGAGYNIIVKDKSKLNIKNARKKINKWMKTDYCFKSGFEFQYLNIKRKIIAEEYLENNKNELYDYKVFCFDGKVDTIAFFSERKKRVKLAFYDLNWNKLNYTFYGYDKKIMPKPKNLDELIKLSEILSQGFAHVRVDFYILNDGSIKFGEMTFYTHSGTAHWRPAKVDKIYGKKLKLPSKKKLSFFNY